MDQNAREKSSGGVVDEGTRTPDLLNANQALSQLSYTPMQELIIANRRAQGNTKRSLAL